MDFLQAQCSQSYSCGWFFSVFIWHGTLASTASMTIRPRVVPTEVGRGSTGGSHDHSRRKTAAGPVDEMYKT